MQTPDQVAGEAREKLASRSEVIGENIRLNIARRRSDLGLSLQQVADRSGLTKAHVWEVEKGRSRNVSVSTIAGLAAALNISEIDLLGLAALRAQPERAAEEMRPAIHAWIREDVPLAGKMNLFPEHVDALIAKLRALPLHPAKDEGGGR